MASLEGKHFSITDPKDVNTVIYKVDKTEKKFKDSPKYTVERLERLDELTGENTKRTFFVDNPSPEGERLVILSFAKEINIYAEVDSWKKSKPEISFKGEICEDECSEGRCVFIDENGEYIEATYTYVDRFVIESARGVRKAYVIAYLATD